MTAPAYMAEPWFAMLIAAIGRSSQSQVARHLALSASTVNQVQHGGGNYGEGTASTARIAQRVLDAYGQWPCPYLSDNEAERVISAEQCRGFAHRDAPTGSPRDLAHWRACRSCDMRQHSAPPVQRVLVPRNSSRRAAEPSISTTTTAGEQA